jgi:hypothetical protein
LDFKELLLLKLELAATAATPHCDFAAVLRRPHISFVLTGSENGSGLVIPVVSVTASTSIGPGGAIVLGSEYGKVSAGLIREKEE